MTSATDNRTTELLCKLLEERGVEYFTNDDERAYDEPARTTWDFVLCGYEMTVTATEFVDIEGNTYLEMDFHHAFTPEQAIAATLGDGKLTAEQVKQIHDCIEKHWHDLPAEYDMPEATALPEYSYDWQAIADELNETMEFRPGDGECERVKHGTKPDGTPRYRCSVCGYGLGDYRWEYCPKCGFKIRKAVKR